MSVINVRTFLSREMTKFCEGWRKRNTTANFWYFHLELNAATAAYLA